MPPLNIMIKPVSSACNMRCSYCFYADEAAHRTRESYGIMQNDTVRNLIRKAFIYADDYVSFAFQGGEPTLAGIEFFKKFIKTVDEYNSQHIDVLYSLQTNGILLTDEFCKLLHENDFLVGVSLDGTEQIHDTFRTYSDKRGSYNDVMRGIKLLQKYNVEFNILSVLSKPIADNIRAVWKALSKFGYVQFIPCIDGLDGKAMPYTLDAESYGKALVEIFRLYRASFFSSSAVHERRMDNYISMLLGEEPEHCGMSGYCATNYVCEADGSIFPCDFYVLDEWKLGNINETSFLRMSKSDVLKRFLDEGDELPEECRHCDYVFICRGGCRRDREPSLMKSRFCSGYKYFFDRCLDEMQELADSLE